MAARDIPIVIAPPPACGLCGYTASHSVCALKHQLCYRCHVAYWKGQTSGLAQAATVARVAAAEAKVEAAPLVLLAICPVDNCFHELEPPGDLPAPGESVLTKIEEGTPEYGQATSRFSATLGVGATIERVFRVNNPALSDMFELCRARMRREMKPTEEKIMFHGSDRTAVGSIIRSGFDIRYSGSNAEALGPGIYLADDAHYSHGFAVEDYGGILCMIVARVLEGRRPEGGRRAAKRGARQREGAGYYDSNFGGNILAVRREQQALPLYVIYYRV